MREIVLNKFSSCLQRGVTLIELVAVIAIMSVSLVGVTAAISGAVSRSADVMTETRAVALAQAYLDEILSRRFDENSAPRGIPPCRTSCTDEEGLAWGPDDSESRAGFDDVDDFHGLVEGFGEDDPLRDAEGVERSGYDEFRIQVSVRYLRLQVGETEEGLGAASEDLSDDKDAKLITVTVSHVDNTEGWKFSVYKANY